MDRTLEQFSMITSIKSSEHAWRDHIGGETILAGPSEGEGRGKGQEEGEEEEDDMKSCIDNITHYLASNFLSLSSSLSNFDQLF